MSGSTLSEGDWRRLAEAALAELPLMGLSVRVEAEVRSGLLAALAGGGSPAIRRVLTSRRELRAWLEARTEPVRGPIGGLPMPADGVPFPASAEGGAAPPPDFEVDAPVLPDFGTDLPEALPEPAAADPEPGPEPGPEPDPEPGPEPAAAATRTVHPRLDAPPAVRVEEPFGLQVGIAATPSAGVLGSPGFQVPTGALTLTVTLLLDGFRTADGSSPVRTLVGSDDVPYPVALVDLVAVDDPAYRDVRGILAVYDIGGHQLGVATRYVRVHAGPDPAPAEPPPERAPKVWALPAGSTPDLQITVARGNDTAGRQLVWTAQSPHEGVTTPAAPVHRQLDGDAAGDWARRVMRGVEARRNAAELGAYLRGVQILVGRQVPAEIWTALRSAADAAGGRPTVLFATAEPFLPWELARVPQPWDAGRPDLLGAQATFGRWLYEDDGALPAPSAAVDVADIAVVKGEYAGSARLPEAEAEADHLVAAYGATLVRAEAGAVLACLRGDPAADAVHFAVHGRLDQEGVQDGIIMNDRSALDPLSILGVETGRPRLAFVNACQVGESQEMLGDTAGVVPSLIQIGAQGVVAPLWKVDDTVAREFAERFYAEVFGGRPVAEVLAEERVRALAAGDAPESTVLAYLFFGHPRLTVTSGRKEDHAPAPA